MTRLALFILTCCLTGIATAAHFASFQVGVLETAAISYNIVTNFSATCDGAANDASAFATFKTTALAYQAAHPPNPLIELVIPSGKTCKITSPQVQFTAGLKRFRLLGNGATMAAGDFWIGGGSLAGQKFLSGGVPTTARVGTVTAGATSVTMTSNACASCPGSKFTGLWSAGDWALITGLDMEEFGYPTGPFYFEYVKVSSVDATNGIITFTTPLVNGYKSTWPVYNAGAGDGTIDQGGPATLYQLGQDWDTEQEFVGLTFADQGALTDTRGRSITFRNVIWQGVNCTNPSQNILWQYIGGSLSNCAIEVDKIITSAIFRNVTARIIETQGATIDNLYLDRVTVTSAMNGTAKYTEVTNGSSFSSMIVGPETYGRANELIISNSNVDALSYAGAVGESDVNRRYTMSGGQITVPGSRTITSAANNGSGLIRLLVNSTSGFKNPSEILVSATGGGCNGLWDANVIDATHVDLVGSTFTATCTGTIRNGNVPTSWAVPGSNVVLQGAVSGEGPVFQVTDVTQDALNTYVQTSLAGSWPTAPLGTSGTGVAASALSVHPHPAPKFTCVSCTGAGLAGFANTPSKSPIGSYYSRTMTGASTNAVAPVFGLLVSADITVNTAYTGSSLNFTLDGPRVGVVNTVTDVAWPPTVNTKVSSVTPREMLPTSTSGAQSGDSLVAPGAGTWLFSDQITPKFATIPGDIGATSVTVTIQTNQGVVNP